MTPLRNDAVSVPLSPREKDALRNYAGSLGMTMAHFVREWTLPEIPPEYWEREKPPPGQMTLGVGEDDEQR